MALVDANIVLRYIIKDNEELALNAKAILENKNVEIPLTWHNKAAIKKEFWNRSLVNI